MKSADLIYSPDDDGWYATVWETNNINSKCVDTIPRGNGVCASQQELITAVRGQYGDIPLNETD